MVKVRENNPDPLSSHALLNSEDDLEWTSKKKKERRKKPNTNTGHEAGSGETCGCLFTGYLISGEEYEKCFIAVALGTDMNKTSATRCAKENSHLMFKQVTMLSYDI